MITNTVYIVIGYICENPADLWGVAVYDSEEHAQIHLQKASTTAKRIQNNISRANKLRGQPFSEEQLQQFRASNQYDPHMRFSDNVIYKVLQAPKFTIE